MIENPSAQDVKDRIVTAIMHLDALRKRPDSDTERWRQAKMAELAASDQSVRYLNTWDRGNVLTAEEALRRMWEEDRANEGPVGRFIRWMTEER